MCSSDLQGAVDALDPRARSRVFCPGRVDGDARTALLRRATLLAYPSLDEGFGFPLLDAMQAGIPVVAANAGSIPEIAGDAAVLVDPLDVDALATALLAVATDDATRRRLVGLGDLQLRRFSWTRCADEMVALYRRVVAGDVDALR